MKLALGPAMALLVVVGVAAAGCGDTQPPPVTVGSSPAAPPASDTGSDPGSGTGRPTPDAYVPHPLPLPRATVTAAPKHGSRGRTSPPLAPGRAPGCPPGGGDGVAPPCPGADAPASIGGGLTEVAVPVSPPATSLNPPPPPASASPLQQSVPEPGPNPATAPAPTATPNPT